MQSHGDHLHLCHSPAGQGMLLTEMHLSYFMVENSRRCIGLSLKQTGQGFCLVLFWVWNFIFFFASKPRTDCHKENFKLH